MNTNKRYSPVQKVNILREHLENQVSVSELSERYNVTPAMIYYWKKQLFEGALETFKQKNSREHVLSKQVKTLEQQVKQKDSLISEIVADNVRLKKKLNGAR